MSQKGSSGVGMLFAARPGGAVAVLLDQTHRSRKTTTESTGAGPVLGRWVKWCLHSGPYMVLGTEV